MKRLAALLGLVAATLAMLALSNGCIFGGDGEPLTLAEYFDQLDKADQETGDKFDAVSAALGENPSLEQIQETYPGVLDIVDSFAGDLEDINRPDELEGVHDDFIDAARGYQDELEKALDGLAGATSLDEANQAFSSEEIGAATQQYNEAYLAVQAEADERQIDASLGCAEEEEGGAELAPTAAQ